MTSRMKTAFSGQKALIPFITAGYPNLMVTEKLLISAAQSGADVLEVSVPFSDPVAGGITIQKADEAALKAGTTTDGVFEMIKHVRQHTQVPLILMSYINPIYVYGIERFFACCADCGIDALNVPDVPYEERDLLIPFCKKYGIVLISIITSATEERISTLSKAAEGMVVCVPAPSCRPGIVSELAEIVSLVKREQEIPCVIGCDAASEDDLPENLDMVDGIVVDTQLVQKIEQYGEACIAPCCDYVCRMKRALQKKTI